MLSALTSAHTDVDVSVDAANRTDSNPPTLQRAVSGPREDGEMRDVSHGSAAPIPVPDPGAELDVIWHFALSINGYDTADITDLAEAEQMMRDHWDRGRGLPDELLELRLTLFFLQRQHRHQGSDPDPETDRYLRAIVAKISEKGGGCVPGPHDFEVFLAKNPK